MDQLFIHQNILFFINKRKRKYVEHYTQICTSLKCFIDNELKLDFKYFGYIEYAFHLEEHRKIFYFKLDVL
jgi:hypothetical protein